MGGQTRIKSLVKEAELYRTQGLLDESKERYVQALELIKEMPQSSGYEKAVSAVEDRIFRLEEEIAGQDQDPVTTELSPELQDLIKRTFSFSQNEEAAAVEGAVALAKFGQYEGALAEFNRLLTNGTRPLVAAKNIIRCHLVLSSTDAAVDQFQQWLSGDLLSIPQLKRIRSFLQDLLSKKGIATELPVVVDRSSQGEPVQGPSERGVIEGPSKPTADPETEKEEDLLDISSVGLTLEDGPRKGSTVELDVSFQSGNMIGLILSSEDKDLLDTLKVGIRLKNLQLYSPMAIFRGDGLISERTEIQSGPRRGSHILNVRIESTSG